MRTFLVICFLSAGCLEAYADSVFTIGNSLTWDTRPGLLDGDVEWHIDCGKNLQYIHDHPANPCLIATSSLWPDALMSTQYDVVTVQPHSGTSLMQDADVISTWMQMQPNATFVIHTGWPSYTNRETIYHADYTGGGMTHSPGYFIALMDELQARHPGRAIRRTYAIDLLDSIDHDIAAGNAPFMDLSDLYRDVSHMDSMTGWYLMHNSMRLALGQPLSDVGFSGLDSNIKAYLDLKLTSAPEPSSLLLAVLALVGLLAHGRRRRR